MGLVKRAGSPFHWMNIRRPGQKPLRRSTGIRIDGGTAYQTAENLTLAKTMLALEEAKYARAKYGLEPTPATARAIPTLATFFRDEYEPWLKRERADRWEQPSQRLQALFFPTLAHVRLDQIRPHVIEGWRAERLATGVEPQSVARELTYLLGLIAKAVEWERLAVSPLATLKVEHVPSPEIIRYLTPTEETRLLRALAVRDASWAAARQRFNAHRAARGKPALPIRPHYKDWLTPAVIVALHTGIRRKELFRLDWRAIDWRAGTLTVTARTSKGKRYPRHIPMNALCRLVLRGWRERIGRDTGPVLVSRNGLPLTYVQTSWDDVLEDAAITDFRWHDLRHTFASKLIQRGVSLLQVSKLLGHRSLKTTMRYAHLAPDQARTAVELLEGSGAAAHYAQPSHTWEE